MKALWGICLTLLLLPAMVEWAPFIRITPLHGEPSPDWSALKNGALLAADKPQDGLSDLLDRNFPLRAPLIRFRNQLDFSLFGQTHAREVAVGKQHTLFHKASVGSQVGSEAMKKSIAQRTRLLQSFSDSLHAHQIPFQIIVAPGKRQANREQLPANAPAIHPSTLVMDALKAAHLPLVNLPDYFEQHPLPDHIPMYPKLGLHWTPYASALAFEQVIRNHPELRNSVHIQLAEPAESPIQRDQELDLWNMLNLVVPFETWPVHRAEVSFSGEPMPKRLLVIGDSFFIGWMEEGWINRCFEEVELLFYGRFIYEGDVTKGNTYTEDLNLMEYLRSFDEIWMMVHEDNLPAFPFGFELHLAQLNP